MIEPTILVAICIGFAEITKRLGLPIKFVPLASLAIGIGLNLGFHFIGVQFGELIIGGIIAGLTGCGLYSGTKTVITK